MKRQPRNKQNSAVSNSRSLRIESLEDRKLMTVAAEMVQMPQESQIGSEHWPEPAAEIAVEKATNDRQGFFSRGLHNNGAFRDRQESGFSRGLHNNGAFREPTGHILWNASDDSETSSDSYTDSGRITYYAYELKNVQVTSVVAADNEQNQLNGDMIFTLHDSNVDKVFGENGLGGQEGEPVAENQFSLNFEEIKVTYRDSGGMKTAGIEADQSAGRLFDDGCPNGLHVDGTSEAADGNSEAATESSADSTDDTLDSTPSNDHDRIGGEGKDDEVPGLPGEDETLTPAGRDFLLDPAKTEGSDGDDIWDVLQGY